MQSKKFLTKIKEIISHTPYPEKNAFGRKAESGSYLDPDDHIIQFVRETLTTYFARAIKKAGIDNPGAVHILRHTAATAVLEAGANIREVQEFLGSFAVKHDAIYTHVVQEKLESAVIRAFR